MCNSRMLLKLSEHEQLGIERPWARAILSVLLINLIGMPIKHQRLSDRPACCLIAHVHEHLATGQLVFRHMNRVQICCAASLLSASFNIIPLDRNLMHIGMQDLLHIYPPSPQRSVQTAEVPEGEASKPRDDPTFIWIFHLSNSAMTKDATVVQGTLHDAKLLSVTRKDDRQCAKLRAM